HVEWLKRVWEEDEKVSKPMLDPQEIETINRQLIEASKTKSLVKLTVYENGSINEYEGTIRALSSQTNTVIIKAKKEIAIPFKNVLGITILRQQHVLQLLVLWSELLK